MNFEIGKRKVLTESHLKELILPRQNQLPGLVIKDVGADNIIVKCTDRKVMSCRIRGSEEAKSVDKRNDLVLIAPWDFQSDRAGIIWRYIAAHANNLEQDGYLKDLRQMNDKVTGL